MPSDPDDREYRRAIERSLTSIENCAAEIVSGLDKLRRTNHDLVGRLYIMDDVQRSLEVVSALAASNVELVRAVGRLSDSFNKWETESGELRHRIVKLEVENGKRL